MNIKTFLIEKVGIDGAVMYTILGRGFQILSSVFTVFFIAKYLTGDEQGYYYTFGSILAIQVFFELGLNGIITQFVAHEACHLSWSHDYQLVGEDVYKSRLSSLLHFCAKWYLVFAVLIIIALIIAGIFFFNRFNDIEEDVVWKLPWILLVLGTALNFLFAPIASFIEGLGKVKEMARIRFVQQIAYPIVIWGGLIIGSKLFVSGVQSLIHVLLLILLVYFSPAFKMLKTIWGSMGHDRISYVKEIFPLQWKIALSWISGYFIFQLFNPVLFATEGATVAGQMGMTMSALTAINTLVLSWITTKVPLFSSFIAKRDFSHLDKTFKKTSAQLVIIGTLLYLTFTGVMFLVQRYDIRPLGIPIGERFLPIGPLLLMVWSIWTMLPINCWATFLRCHKKEPLVLNSVVMGVLCCISTPMFGKLYGLYGICISFACLRVVSIIWIYCTYKIKKTEYRAE